MARPAVEEEWIPLGVKYGCLVNTFPRITENLYVNFIAQNTLFSTFV